MLSIFKKFFAKSGPAPVEQPTPRPAPEQSNPIPGVEVAHLSLAAILDRLPEDLKPLVQRTPEASATVALPIPTILKQLPTGAVRMSLASLHRQAGGVFAPLPAGEKRMVDIPLAEIFRHVDAQRLRRRPDQRSAEIPSRGYDLFGNAANRFEIAPSTGEELLDDSTTFDLSGTAPRSLQMDAGLRDHFSNAASTRRSSASASASAPAPAGGAGFPQRSIAPPPGFAPAAAASASAPEPSQPPLVLPLTRLAANWPEEIRAEIESLNPETRVSLPAAEISAGLAKGRVTFPWGQIRMWLDPLPESPTAVGEDTPLTLPLKVVAPAFLSAAKKAPTARKNVSIDESIPSLFNSASAPEPQPEPEPAFSPTPEPEAAPAGIPLALAPPQPVEKTVGDILGEPHRTDWTPSEIVARTIKLPGVAGAIVALQEGLQVATSLPEGVKGEVVAAFLPQIFARLNQYAGEMRLGEVDDLLFTTHGAHCQIYRLGYVYFAVLGKPGESLPWQELRLISTELARQTNH